MTNGGHKIFGAVATAALCVAGLAVPSAANVPQRETGFLSGCVTDATGHVALTFEPTLTGVAALIGIGAATITGASGGEVESLAAGSFFEDTTFVKTEAGVAQTIDVEGPPLTSCSVEFGVDEVPANDQQAAADVIAGSTGSVQGSTRAATLDVPDEPQAFVNATRVVWYEWTAPATGPMRFEAQPKIGNGFLDDAGIWTALGLAIYGPSNAFTPLIIGGNTTADGQAAYGGLFEVDVTAGTEYKISVSSGDGTGEFASAFGYSAPGAFTLEWEPVVGPLPTITPGGAAVTEVDSGTQTLNIPVTLSAASTQTVAAQWNTVQINSGNEHEAWPNGYLGGNWDYVPASGVVSFAPGQTSATVPITVNADLFDEWDELFAVSFHDPTNATVGGFYGLGFGQIVDNDPLPVVVASLLQYRVTECECTGGTVTSFDVTLSAPTGRTATVDVALPFAPGPGRAMPGVDFVGGTGRFTFTMLSTRTVGVTILPDDLPEPDEHIAFALQNPVNATIGGFYGIGTLTIPANDGG